MLDKAIEDLVSAIREFSFEIEEKQGRGFLSKLVGTGYGGPAGELSRSLEVINSNVFDLGMRSMDPSVKDRCSALISVLGALDSNCAFIGAYSDIPAYQSQVTDAIVDIVDVGKQLAIQTSH